MSSWLPLVRSGIIILFLFSFCLPERLKSPHFAMFFPLRFQTRKFRATQHMVQLFEILRHSPQAISICIWHRVSGSGTGCHSLFGWLCDNSRIFKYLLLDTILVQASENRGSQKILWNIDAYLSAHTKSQLLFPSAYCLRRVPHPAP